MLDCPQKKCKAVFIRGPAAVGKTTIARKLKQQLPEFRLLERDSLCKPPSSLTEWLKLTKHKGMEVFQKEVSNSIVVGFNPSLFALDEYESVIFKLIAPWDVIKKRYAERQRDEDEPRYLNDETLFDHYQSQIKSNTFDFLIDTSKMSVNACIIYIIDQLS